jgi:chitinase
MAQVQRYVDTVNLMAYDYYEPSSDAITGHHAPLFTNPADPKKISADASVQAFEKAGVPAAKILLGLPFYGHMWGQVAWQNHGLYQPGKPVPGAYSNYGAITSTMLNHGFDRYWDSKASAPYLYNPDKKIFVSYDDPQSIAVKCSYVLNHKLGGVMFWDYSGDPSGALLRSIQDSFHRQAARGASAK